MNEETQPLSLREPINPPETFRILLELSNKATLSTDTALNRCTNNHPLTAIVITPVHRHNRSSNERNQTCPFHENLFLFPIDPPLSQPLFKAGNGEGVRSIGFTQTTVTQAIDPIGNYQDTMNQRELRFGERANHRTKTSRG